jgi:uncharacterized membrane protein
MAPDAEDERAEEDSGIAGALRRNIEALRREREREEAQASVQERLAAAITRFTGSMRFVYLHIALVGAWVVVNLGWIPGAPRFDPTFVVLAMVASVEAIFLSTFILISQNRAAAIEQKRADLNLQISLLAEHEITQLVRVVAALGEKLNVAEARDPSLEPLKRDVQPEAVLQELEDRNA